MEGYIAQVILFAGNFAPKNWAFCQGQILQIAQNTALFSIIGTMYGGNGTTTFALPDLRGRAPVGAGQGPGLPNYTIGEQGGEPNHTLLVTEMPLHNHLISANGNPGGSKLTQNCYPASNASTAVYDAAANTTMNAGMVGQAGGSQPHNNMQPYLGMNYIICVFGIYPSRN
ncbi:MAG: phage tail protein [Blastocatellia bacterium]